MNLPQRQRKRLRLKDFNYNNPSHVYFLTLCARHLSCSLTIPSLAKTILDSLLYIRKKDRGKIYCYCLMPDHMHLAMSPMQALGVSDIIGQFKSFTTQQAWRFDIKGKLWQKSYYDHIARNEENLVSICDYILANPVRKGLVGKAEQWQYSGLWDPLPV